MIVARVDGVPQVVNMFDGIQRKLPQAADKDLWNISQMVKAELRKSKRMAQIEDYSGRLSADLAGKPMKLRKFVYGIPLPEYAYMLNRMRPHFAPIGGGRLREWLDRHRPLQSTHGAPGYKPGYLYVMSHPFIEMAFERVRQRLLPELERGAMVNVIRRKGK